MNPFRWLIAGVVALLLVAGVPAGPVAAADAAPPVPVLLTFASGSAAGQASDQLDGAALVTPSVVKVALSPAEQARAAGLPGVVAVEVDGVVTGADLPAFNDPCIVAVQECLGVGSWYLEALGLSALWAQSLGAGVTIAVIDGGVDSGHPDLAGSLAAPEVDLISAEPDPSHGTAVAGLALARAGNGVGIVGVAPEADLLSFRVLDAARNGRVSDVVAALVQATDAGADVINLSLEGSSSAALESAIRYAQDRRVVVVAAAGNDGSSEPSFPAALPGVVAVGATDRDGVVAPFSNRGRWVDVYAPGTTDGSVGLPAPALGGGVRSFSGTSAAAPIVSGLVALLLAHNPDLTPAEIESVLRSASTDAPGGAAVIDGRALAQVPQILVTSPSNPIGNVDVVRLAPGGASVFGWALDPDTSQPIEVHAYVDGTFAVRAPADRERADVAASEPGYGAFHGYHLQLVVGPGAHNVCAYGINQAAGSNDLLGCSTVNVPVVPFGALDVVQPTEAGVAVRGWAIAADSADPIDVRIEVAGDTVRVVQAADQRADVGAVHVGFGSAHGFSVDLPLASTLGREVCVRAVGPRGTKLLGCARA